MTDLHSLKEDAFRWASRKNGWVRLPLLFWGFYVTWRILTNQNTFTPFDWLNLGIHELGHLVFMSLGEFIGIVGGSFAQVVAPIASIFMFMKQEDYFGASFCFCWLAESLLNLNFYIADANIMALTLVSPLGSDPIHDWNYLLSHLGLLRWDQTLAFLTRGTGFCSCLFFLITGGALIWKMQQRLPGVSK